MADFRRVVFTISGTDYHLGYYEYVTFAYEGNTQVKVVPRAKGVKIWDTETLGGGEITISVRVFITATSRLDLEKKINNLITNIGGKTGDLKIENDLILTDCSMKSLSMDDTSMKDIYFTIIFVKSA